MKNQLFVLQRSLATSPSTTAALILAAAVLIAVLGPVTSVRADHGVPEYTDEQIQDLIAYAFDTLDNLEDRVDRPPVTGDPIVDDRIWRQAVWRGYALQPNAVTALLESADGMTMQGPTAAAWEELKDAAGENGHHIAITSAYRPVAEQRELFLARLAGTTDEAIDDRLAVAAPPGASRHHTGYALDIREVDDTFGDFGATGSYAWMAADNYHNAMRYGFVPSYPPGITDAGPDPEAWEWVHVGEAVIFHDGPFWDVLPNALFVTEISWMSETTITHGCADDGKWFCPEVTVDRGQMAAFLRRALKLSGGSSDFFVDDDDSIFEGDINAIALEGITTGCNPPDNTRFCPDDDLTRGQMAAFIARALELPQSSMDFFEDDDTSVFESDINAIAAMGITHGCNPPENTSFCPSTPLSRGEMAAMLYRARHLLP